MSDQLDAFQSLLELAERSLAQAKGLPAQVDITPHWSGIGFSLAGQRMVAPLGEVVEILVPPQSTRLPGVQPWVKGVSNVRGRLLPLFDLESFFGSGLSGSRKAHRVMTLEMDDLYSGLIVSEVYGMQHFPVDCFTQGAPESAAQLTPFIEGHYHHQGVDWMVFRPSRLAQDSKFFNAAIA